MTHLGWAVLLACLFTAGAMYFSIIATTLRIFSRVKLLDIFKADHNEQSAEKLTDLLAENTEKLVLVSVLYRFIFNMAMLLALLIAFSAAQKGNLQISDYIIAIIIAITIFLFFSLAIPHALAKYAGEKILSKTYKILIVCLAFTKPILYVVHLYDILIRRLAGIAETTPLQLQEEKQEQFITGLEQHRMEGAVDQEEQEMIENVLELSDTTADEIMTPRTDIIAVDAGSGLKTILETINNAGHTRVPVYEENIDNIIGFVYAKDLLTEIGKDLSNFNLRSKMRQAYFVPETKPLRVLLHEFQNQKLHIAVVLDEYGGTAGIVTLEDILEELVGEINDEYEKTPAEPIKQIDADTVEVDARTYVDDLNDQFDLDLPEDEDYDTIGGFVFSHLGYIPKTGEKFDYENLKFNITSAEARKVKRIKIQKITEQKNAD
ncbi:MAG: HlyC/CorC family transporter [Planctomycetes bacterium]|nr:HlyC/CorC family transporter [Planctomycetota bacterium]